MTKNITQRLFLFGAAMLFAMAAQAQTTILTQNFEGTPNWSKTQNSPSHGWSYGPNTSLQSSYFPIPAHTKFACSNDDKYDDTSFVKNKADRDMLISPSLNLSSYSAVILNFDAYFGVYANDQSKGTVEVSIDGGTNWTTAYTVPALNAWQTLHVDLTPYVGNANVKVAFKYNDQNRWSYGFAVDNVTVVVPPNYDMSLTVDTIPELVTVTTASPTVIPLSGWLSNLGGVEVNTVNINWSINGVYGSHHVDNLTIPTAANSRYNLAQHLEISLPGTYHIKVWVSDPNDQVDANNSNDTISATVVALGARAHKNVLLEEATGAWCGWCVDGAYVVDTISAAHSDVVAVALHNGDGMTTTAGDAVISQYISGFPSGIVDRTVFGTTVEQDRGYWNDDATQQLSMIAPASVGVLGNYNSTTRVLEATVVTKFQGQVSGDYRVNVYICENDVKGTGTNYNQHNYLSGDATYIGSPYYSQPSVITGFHHMRVVRQMLGGTWGTTGVIPATVNVDDEFANKYTYTIPAGWKDTSLFLVAVLQKYTADQNNRPIVNVVKGSINGYNQTPVENYFFTTTGDSLHYGDSLVIQHGDSLHFDGGTLVFQLGDTVIINGDTTVLDSINQTIIIKPGDDVTVSGAHGGNTLVPVNNYYTQTSYGMIDLTAVVPTGIDNVESKETINVYPNPANDNLNLAMNLLKGGDVHVMLTNMAGQQVRVFDAGNMAGGNVSLNIKTGDLPAGVYVLNVRTAQSNISHKVVIAR